MVSEGTAVSFEEVKMCQCHVTGPDVGTKFSVVFERLVMLVSVSCDVEENK